MTFPYLAFLREIGKHDVSSSLWSEPAVGLATLRVLDGWMDGDPAEIWGSTATRRLIEALTEDAPCKQRLAALLTITAHPPTETSRKQGLMLRWKYARALERQSDYQLAISVYESILARLPHALRRRRVTCLIRIGMCQLFATNLAQASRTLRKAQTIARANHDLVAVLRAEIGAAKIAIVRGNLPLAERMLWRVAKRARRGKSRAILARALQDLATVAHLKGQYEDGLGLLRRAMRLATTSDARSLILSDMGASLLSLGMDQLARHLYAWLARTADREVIRWAALVALLDIESVLGNLEGVREHEKSLWNARKSPHQHSFLLLRSGEAYERLGHRETAVALFERALAYAVEHGINQLIIEAEEAIRRAQRSDAPLERPRQLASPERELALEIRALTEADSV
jgi:tetratricopeptide (TPR) repeat protein